MKVTVNKKSTEVLYIFLVVAFFILTDAVWRVIVNTKAPKHILKWPSLLRITHGGKYTKVL